MARSIATFVLTFALLSAGVAFARTMFGAEVGEHCNDFVLSCRATRGVFTVNGCVRTGPEPEDTYCSYACQTAEECPEGWTCEAAGAWSSLPGAVDEVHRVCAPGR